jgi:ribosomal protein S18 acetylase RimI-like enzyme
LPGGAAVNDAPGAGGATLLRRLEAQLHEALAEGTEVHELAGFRLHIWRTPDPFYRNVAVPVPAAVGWPEAIAELRAAFARADRRARVEFFGELWPGLAAALESAGFTVESRAPVMASSGRPPSPPPGISPARVHMLDGATPRPLLRACLEGAAAAFHESAAILAPGELERLHEGLAAGTLRSGVVLGEGGTPVAGASVAGRGPVAELLGVWVDPAHRRRGLAHGLCSALLADFFARGGEVAWLTAATAEGSALYRQLGFVPCGTHLDYADQAGTAARADS